jgi:CxxC motif-containing protein
MKLICISCPRGCAMTVTMENGAVKVSGNQCKRGEAYAVAEMTCPMRTLTSSIFIDGGDCPLLSIKTKDPIPKAKLAEALEDIRTIKAKAPINIGDVVLKNIAGTGVDLVATRKVQKVS